MREICVVLKKFICVSGITKIKDGIGERITFVLK